MIYTIGYQNLTPPQLRNLMDSLRVDLLIDVRSVPRSRKRGFSQTSLLALFGTRYEWRGDRLGGRSPGVTKAGLDELASDKRNLMLLCLEHLPGDCHRHHAIAVPLDKRGVACLHVVDNEAVPTYEVTRALDSAQHGDCAYSAFSLADVVDSLA